MPGALGGALKRALPIRNPKFGGVIPPVSPDFLPFRQTKPCLRRGAPPEVAPGAYKVLRALGRVTPPQQACFSLPQGNPAYASRARSASNTGTLRPKPPSEMPSCIGRHWNLSGKKALLFKKHQTQGPEGPCSNDLVQQPSWNGV